ncbi:MAG: acyl-CoA synthetase [Frankiaceae bacterium]
MPPRPGRDAAPNLTDYDAELGAFALAAPERFNPVVDVVEAWAAEDPEAVALRSLDGAGAQVAAHSAARLADEARRAAAALATMGIGKGDRAFVMLPRVPAWYVAVLGLIRLGAVPMPGPNLLTPRDIAYRIQRADAVAVITDGQGAAKLAEVTGDLPTVRHRVCWTAGGAAPAGWRSLDELVASHDGSGLDQAPTAADDPMLIYFTSGTVAYPKMVLHTQASYGLGHVVTARYWHDLRSGDVHWTVSDTGWAKAAWGKLFGQWHQRATVVQMDMGRPSADLVLRTLAEQQVTSFCAPPTLYRQLVLADLRGYDLSALRHCTSAGEPLNPEVIRVWREGTGLTVHDGYGQTETVNIVANYRSVPVRPGSMGRSAPGWQVDIVDDDGAPVPTGTVGNIAVRVAEQRPLGLFAGYYRDEEATRDAFRAGWYFTGDKASKDEDGYLWFEGRSDDVITSAAYRIGPFEVESALVEHPAVAEAAVVGRDDPQRTQVVVAFCVLAPGRSGSAELTSELQDHVKRVTAPYKYPREIHYVEELPKTVSGKIRRTELREQLRGQG